jgi:predicted RNA binding protein YcfA (HicA-like mRNA interferase family)
MKVREVIRRLERDGWYRVKSKSGHRQFKHPRKRGRVTVSGKLNKEMPEGTLKNVWRQAGLPEEG